MAVKNNIDVIIGGKVLTLSGYESEAYLQQIGSYINHKIIEITKTEGFNHLSYDIQNMFIELNIADDYFKAKQQVEDLEDDLKQKEKEIYDFKHDLINEKLKLEETEKTKDALKLEINELQKKIIKLQTRLREKSDDLEIENELE
jgi:cell division protein ZapA